MTPRQRPNCHFFWPDAAVFSISLALGFLLLLSFGARAEANALERQAFKRHAYVWRAGDTLTGVLFQHGLGRTKGKLQIYGRGGWLERNVRANPDISDWDQIPPGRKVTLILPLQPKASRPKSLPTPVVRPVLRPVSRSLKDSPKAEHRLRTMAERPERKRKAKLAAKLPELSPAAQVAAVAPAALVSSFTSSALKAYSWSGFIAFATIPLSLLATWLMIARQRHRRLRRWRHVGPVVLDQLMTCEVAAFNRLLEAALADGRKIAVRELEEALRHEDGAMRQRAKDIYRRLGLAEADRIELLARRAEDRLAAALRLSTLANPALTREIVESFDGEVRVSEHDLSPLFLAVAQYDARGFVLTLRTMTARAPLRAAIRALRDARIVEAINWIEEIAEGGSADPKVRDEAYDALLQLKVARFEVECVSRPSLSIASSGARRLVDFKSVA